MKMQIFPSDILYIGYSIYGNNAGNTCVRCDETTAQLEKILLREILKTFDETNYEIIGQEEILENDNTPGIEYVTNFPWEKFQEMFGE